VSENRRGPYMNEDGDWWVAVEDVTSFREARAVVVACLSYDIPEDGTLRYRGQTRTSCCEAPAGEHTDAMGNLDPANCDATCRRDVLAYHFEENRQW
jgi:hypothetical protein